MKISGAKQVHYESGPNMTPLVDVVMVILIFLMLAGSFGSGEKYMVGSTQLKSKGAGGPVPPGWVKPITMELRINDRGGVRTEWGETYTDNDKLTAALDARLGKVVQENAGVGIRRGRRRVDPDARRHNGVGEAGAGVRRGVAGEVREDRIRSSAVSHNISHPASVILRYSEGPLVHCATSIWTSGRASCEQVRFRDLGDWRAHLFTIHSRFIREIVE